MSDDDSSVGHPEQQPDTTPGNAIDVYFNLNPEKFGPMPTADFLKLAAEYQTISESYNRAKQALQEIDEKKKQLEDDARSVATNEGTENPSAQNSIETHEPTEEHHDPLEQAIDHANEHSHEESHSLPESQHVEQQDHEHPQISPAETDIASGPAL